MYVLDGCTPELSLSEILYIKYESKWRRAKFELAERLKKSFELTYREKDSSLSITVVSLGRLNDDDFAELIQTSKLDISLECWETEYDESYIK
jgi:hypothetical protein